MHHHTSNHQGTEMLMRHMIVPMNDELEEKWWQSAFQYKSTVMRGAAEVTLTISKAKKNMLGDTVPS